MLVLSTAYFSLTTAATLIGDHLGADVLVPVQWPLAGWSQGNRGEMHVSQPSIRRPDWVMTSVTIPRDILVPQSA